MAQKTTHVRLRQATMGRLKAEIDRMVKAYTEGQQDVLPVGENNNRAYAGISVDDLINHLLDFKAGHRERVKKSRRRPAAAEGGGQ